MPTFNFKLCRSRTGSAIVIGAPEGSLVLDSIVDGDNTVLLTIPYENLERIGVCIIPTADLVSEDMTATYDVSGSLSVG